MLVLFADFTISGDSHITHPFNLAFKFESTIATNFNSVTRVLNYVSKSVQ